MFSRSEERWQRRWEERSRPPVQRVTATASCEVRNYTPAEVWAFVRPAETSVLLNEDVIRAFTVPGTGPGVGEQQCTVSLVDGREAMSVLTVMAVEENHYAEVGNPDEPESGSRYEVQAAEGGTVYSATSWWDVPEGHPRKIYAECEGQLAAHLNKHVRRVKALLESGVLPRPASD